MSRQSETSSPTTVGSGSSFRHGLTIALATALVLLAARALLLLWLEAWHRRQTFEHALWDLESQSREVLWSALLAAVAAAALLTPAVASSSSSRARGTLRVVFAAVIVAPLVWCVLCGWPLANERFTPNLNTDKGVRFALQLAGVALIGTLAWTALLKAAARSRRFAACWPSRGLALALVSLLAAWPIVARAATWIWPPEHLVTQVVHEVAFEPTSWRVVEQHPQFPPAAGVITPSIDYRDDGGDQPGLVMPPPCEITFTAPPADGPLALDFSAGVEWSFKPPNALNQAVYRVAFEVLGDGQRLFREVIVLDPTRERASRSWRRAPAGGIRLAPGSTITLRTRLVEPADLPPERTPRISAGFGDVALIRTVAHEIARASADEPNIVFIVVDTLRSDHLSCYGETRARTPVLDGLAERGVLFERAYSTASWTWPATASLLTGLWPETHGVTSSEACYLSAAIETLPEAVADQGYVTGAFSCNPLITPSKNFDQGLPLLDADNQFRKSSAVHRRIAQWLEEQANARFFLYLHLVDPHAPHEPSPAAEHAIAAQPPADFPGPNSIANYHKDLVAGRGRDAQGRLDLEAVVPSAHQEWIKSSYLACVLTADEYIGRVLAELDRHGLLDRTLIAVTSDHGEELFQRGFATHGQSLYEELMRVPLIFAGPNLPRGVRVGTPVSTRHVAPTLAARAGARMRGVSDAMDLLELERVRAEPLFFSSGHGWLNGNPRVQLYGVQVGDWVLHYIPNAPDWGASRTAPASRSEVHLFDLARDPRQEQDLAASAPEKVESLRAVLLDHLAQAARQRPTVELGASDTTMQMLRNIGYIGDD